MSRPSFLGRGKCGKFSLSNVGNAESVKQTIRPEIEVLMEDLYERCDCHQSFFEKIEMRVP